MFVLIAYKSFFYNSRETQNSVAHAVDVLMAQAKRIYILIVKVNKRKLFSFFSSRCFLKEIENMFSVFLSSYRNTCESLGELEKAVETLACGLIVFPQYFSFSQTSTHVSITR